MKEVAILGWIAAALVLLYLRQSWDKLPPRVAIHFGFNLTPDAWADKRVLGRVTVLAALLMPLVVTVMAATQPRNGPPLMVVIVLLGAVATPAIVLWQAIKFNLTGERIHPLWVWAPVATAVVLSIAAAVFLPHSRH